VIVAAVTLAGVTDHAIAVHVPALVVVVVDRQDPVKVLIALAGAAGDDEDRSQAASVTTIVSAAKSLSIRITSLTSIP
jgi:hypothetical protein